MFRRKFDDVARGTNHDLAFERQLLCDRGAQRRFSHIFAHHERADRADVNETEFGQLFRDLCWLAPIGSADVHRTKKYDPAHANHLL